MNRLDGPQRVILGIGCSLLAVASLFPAWAIQTSPGTNLIYTRGPYAFLFSGPSSNPQGYGTYYNCGIDTVRTAFGYLIVVFATVAIMVLYPEIEAIIKRLLSKGKG